MLCFSFSSLIDSTSEQTIGSSRLHVTRTRNIFDKKHILDAELHFCGEELNHHLSVAIGHGLEYAGEELDYHVIKLTLSYSSYIIAN